MRYIKFTISCQKCGHRNRPDNNTRLGIAKTLGGGFNTCRKCGHVWEKIHVPFRPLVKKIYDVMLAENLTFSNRVELFTYKGCGKNHVPSGRGY